MTHSNAHETRPGLLRRVPTNCIAASGLEGPRGLVLARGADCFLNCLVHLQHDVDLRSVCEELFPSLFHLLAIFSNEMSVFAFVLRGIWAKTDPKVTWEKR